jgi:hypothetical protein
MLEIHPLEERIRQLCEKAKTANDCEAAELFAELKALLAEHASQVRKLARATLNRTEDTGRNAA